MNATFRIHFLDSNDEVLGCANLEKDIDFVPPTGMEVMGGPWEDSETIKVLSVDYNIYHDNFFIRLGPPIVVSKAGIKNYAAVCRSADWELIGPIAQE